MRKLTRLEPSRSMAIHMPKTQEAGDGTKLAGTGFASGLRAPLRRGNGGKCQR